MEKISITPLYYVVQGGHKELAELLIDKAADLNFKGRRGATPLLIAVNKDCNEIVKLPREHAPKK